MLHVTEQSGGLMGEYIAVNGHPTWCDENGSGDPVLLLHGAFSHCDDLLEGFAPLADHYRLVAFDRRGHGRTADTGEAFHYDDMADETIAVLERLDEPAHVVGYSDGGIVALLVALTRPELVRSLVLIGTNYHFDGLVPGVFDDVGPESELVEVTLPAYADRSPDGAEHYPIVVSKTSAMFKSEPTMTTADLGRIAMPALVLVGDDDAVEVTHTWSLYESLPAGQLAVVPAASHLVGYEKPELVVQLVRDFLHAGADVTTMMPIRRA
jgi:pimeloyl-ACP methyl ester carboxylesterase